MECDNCGRRFDKAANLHRHANKKRPRRPPDYTGKNYASYQSLWQHNAKRCGQAATVQTNETEYQGGIEPTDSQPNANEIESTNACMCVLVCVCDATLPNEKAREESNIAEELQKALAEADQLREESQRQREADTARILELEAAYDDLVELQRATIRKLLEREAQEDQLDKDTAAILSKSKIEIEQARAEAKHAKDAADQSRMEIRSIAQENLKVLEERQ